MFAARDLCDLFGESRLADTGLTEDEQQLRPTELQAGIERASQRREFGVASDEGRVHAAAALAGSADR